MALLRPNVMTESDAQNAGNGICGFKFQKHSASCSTFWNVLRSVSGWMHPWIVATADLPAIVDELCTLLCSHLPGCKQPRRMTLALILCPEGRLALLIWR